MAKKYSRLVRIDGNIFDLAFDLKNKLGYNSLGELFGDSIYILKNKDIKKKRILRELDF